MTTRLEGCGCRWCADPHPGGMVLFVTLPSNKHAYRTSKSGFFNLRDKHARPQTMGGEEDEDGNPTTLFGKTQLAYRTTDLADLDEDGRTFIDNSTAHTYGRLFIPPGGLDGRDIDEVVERRIPWACDNGSFNVFDQDRFEQMMDRLALQPYCHFVAAPDHVWNKEKEGEYHLSAIKTIEKFLVWAPIIREAWDLPVAMVGQDGLERYDIPWELMDAYFVGGSDKWKTGAESEHIIREAQRRGLWVHVGRVSSNERIAWCQLLGVSSFDGSAFGRFRDANDKSDGLGRLQAGLMNAGAVGHHRAFVTDLEGNHAVDGHHESEETSCAEPSQSLESRS